MIQLYGRRNSINVQKVSWALCELNLEFTWHDEHGKFGTVNVENYEKLNPQLIVPTLDHNGTIINQSNSIVRYLYRKYTDVYEISKAEDIATAEQWMEFQATDLQLNMTPIALHLLHYLNILMEKKGILLLKMVFMLVRKLFQVKMYHLS